MDIGPKFWREALQKRKIIEFGTMRWEEGKPTHHRDRWNGKPVDTYVMADVMRGPDVDVVCDIHNPPAMLKGEFSCFLAVSVWEHLKKPWIAADQVYDLLEPGGIFMISTHQTFPIHGYPHDYFRFTKEALLSCFEQKPWETLEAESGYPCIITPEVNGMNVWNFEARGHIHAAIWGRKKA